MDKLEVNFYEYWVVLKKHQRLIFTVVLGTFLITAFFTLRSPNIYEAVTTFYFPMNSGKGESLGAAAQTVLGKEGAGLFSSLLPSGNSELQDYTKAILESRKIAEILDDRMRLTEHFHLKRKNQVYNILRGITRVRLTNEGIMEITVQSTNPQFSADVANGYVDAYREYSSTSTLSLAKKHRIDVEERRKELSAQLHRAEADMARFQLKHKVADFTQQERLLISSLQALHAEQISGAVALQAAEEGMDRVLRLSGQQVRIASSQPLVTPSFSDPIILSLRDQLAEVFVKYSQAKLTETPANPELKSYQAQVRNIESALRDQLHRQLRAQYQGVSDDFLSTQIKIEQQKARQSAIKTGIQKLEKAFEAYPGVNAEFLQVERRLKILEALDTYLASEYEKARLEESKEAPDVQVLDKAIPPDSKIGPHRLYNLSVGFFLGLFLGIAAAFLLESLRPSLLVVKETDGRAEDYELALAEKPIKN